MNTMTSVLRSVLSKTFLAVAFSNSFLLSSAGQPPVPDTVKLQREAMRKTQGRKRQASVHA